mmetsp:Transcript_14598/g.38872  ORF Transcript_14598/g.38872 Transcript_14598/m.38872 type:complete len:306 (+) Transcript_14598:344-1261(+)
MPGGMCSSRYMSATTVPASQPSPVLALTLSPTAKRSDFSFLSLASGVRMHASNASLSAPWSRFLPMKTSLLVRRSSGFQSSSQSPLKIMWTAWYTKRLSELAMFSTPFIRKMSAPLVCRISETHACTRSRSTSASLVMLVDVTVESCSCSPSVLRNSGSISRVRFRSKPPTLRTFSTETLDMCERWIGANALIALIRASTRTKSSSLTRSVLLSRIRSANATCSTASFSAPSGFSSSRCCSTCLASTSVMMPSSLAKALTASSTKKVCATGAGSAMPVVSMMMPSSLSLPDACRFASLLRITIRS